MMFPFDSLVSRAQRARTHRCRPSRFRLRLRPRTRRFRPFHQTGRSVLFHRHDRLQGHVQCHRHRDAGLGSGLRSGPCGPTAISSQTNRELDLHLADVDRWSRPRRRLHRLRLLPGNVGRWRRIGSHRRLGDFWRRRSRLPLLLRDSTPIVASTTVASSGHVSSTELWGFRPQVLAVGVVLMAVGCFIGAEKVEAIFSRKKTEKPEADEEPIASAFRAPIWPLLRLDSWPYSRSATLWLPYRQRMPRLSNRSSSVPRPWHTGFSKSHGTSASSMCAVAKPVPKSGFPAPNVSRKTTSNLGLEYVSGHKDLIVVTETGKRYLPRRLGIKDVSLPWRTVSTLGNSSH